MPRTIARLSACRDRDYAHALFLRKVFAVFIQHHHPDSPRYLRTDLHFHFSRTPDVDFDRFRSVPDALLFLDTGLGQG